MSYISRERREKLEQRLRTAVLEAEHKLNQMTPENQEEALQYYAEVLSRIRRLVVLGKASTVAHGSLPL